MNKELISDENHRKRLLYRSWHRGCKETDVILGNFAEQRLSGLPHELLAVYEQFLDEDDVEIWAWLTGKPCDHPQYQPLLEMLKGYGIPTE